MLRTSFRNDSVKHTSATPTLLELSALSRPVTAISVTTLGFSTSIVYAGKIASRNNTRAVIITGFRPKRSDIAPPASAKMMPAKPFATEAPNASALVMCKVSEAKVVMYSST